jgi:hypothetical protein
VSECEILDFLARWSLHNRVEASASLWEEIMYNRRNSRLAVSPPILPLPLAPTMKVLSSVLLLFGGSDSEVETSTMAYNPAIDACTELDPPSLPFPWASMGALHHGRAVYLCGGEARPGGGQSRTKDRRQFWRLCLDTLEWTQLPNTSKDRHNAALAILGGQIYAIGGQNGRGEATRSAERFDIAAGQWADLPDMEEPRTLAAAIVVENKIHVIGGSDGRNDLSSVAVFDPAGGQWSRGRRLPAARSAVRAALLSGSRVLVAGGTTDGLTLRTCITADVAAGGRWKPFRPLVRPRQSHCLASLDGGRFVVAVGGREEPGLELLEGERASWEEMTELQEMEEDRTGAAACVIPLAALGSQLINKLQRSWTQ